MENIINIGNTEKKTLGSIQITLRNKIKLYQKRALEIEQYLSKKPQEQPRFQDEFNSEIDNIFQDILDFEKENFAMGHREKVYKLKKIFVKRFRKVFMRGCYGPWSITKPLGYAGDFKIIDDIYQNNPSTTGFDRLFDNYFMMSAISVAVRNRKEDFKRLIIDFINKRKGQLTRIMNLGFGSCREIKEIISSNALSNKDAIFDCYDYEIKAMEFAKYLLKGCHNVNLIHENVLRICTTKHIYTMINKKYDFIYATGFFDYLSHRTCVRLVKNLRQLLNYNGIVAISNVRDKYSNPSLHYMEWAGDWNVIYRTDEEFRNIFLEAGFKSNELQTQFEKQKIIQYIIATNMNKV